MAAALWSIEVEPRAHLDCAVRRHSQVGSRIQFVFAQQNRHTQVRIACLVPPGVYDIFPCDTRALSLDWRTTLVER